MGGKLKLHEWDASEYLRDEQDIALFIEAALDEAPDDVAFIASVGDVVAKARHRLNVASTTGDAPSGKDDHQEDGVTEER